MAIQGTIPNKKFSIDRILQPHHLFLGFSLVFGLLFCLGTAPFLVPDEFAHFYRAYQVSQFKLMPEARSTYEVGGQLPQSFSLLEDTFLGMTKLPKTTVSLVKLNELLRAPLQPQQTQFVNFKNSAIYAPAGYIPQALGLLLGRVLKVSLLSEFYLGRIFNLLFWILCTYAAIRVMPVHKWVLFVFGLMPMTISQAASLSVDGILNGLSFLFVALVVRAACDDTKKPGWKDFLLWIILISLITLTKPAYIILGGLLLIIPYKNYGSWKTYVPALALTAGIPLLAYLGWTKALSFHGISMSYDPLFDPNLQTRWILDNLLVYTRILIQNYGRMALPLLVSSIGYFGWLNQPQPAFVYPLFTLFCFYTMLFDQHPYKRILFWQRIMIFGVILFGLLTIATGIYIVSNPFAYGQIDGIQGRYFIPLGPLFGLIIFNRVIRIPGVILNILVPVLSLLFLVIGLQTVLQRIQF